MKRRKFVEGSVALGLLGTFSSISYPVAALSGSSPQKTKAAGRTAVSNPLTPPAHGQIPVAFIVSRGTVMIDLAGPWEVFNSVMIMSRGSSMDDQMPFQTYTVAESTQPVTLGGIKIIPDYTFANAPTPKIVVIPAQAGQTEAMLDWIRKATKTTDVTMSVCTGAFILAHTWWADLRHRSRPACRGTILRPQGRRRHGLPAGIPRYGLDRSREQRDLPPGSRIDQRAPAVPGLRHGSRSQDRAELEV